jgi:chromosomal replication initiation ATPase DnaA
VNRLKARFYEEKSHPQIPESVALAPELSDIEDAVCLYYQVDRSELIQSRRGCSNEPRAVAIYLARILRGDRLGDIGAEFHLRGYSSVSSVLERTKRQLTEDEEFHERLDQVKEGVLRKLKGQTET